MLIDIHMRHILISGILINFLFISCKSLIEEPKVEPKKDFQTMQDTRDGQVYKTVAINNKTWFAENLRYAGSIQQVQSAQSWASSTQPAWSNYDNDATKDAVYGKLYNGYAVKVGGLCPPGWHIPTSEEFTELTNYLGGFDVAGMKMKALNAWKKYDPYNDQITNESGWSGLPGGFREPNGTFGGLEGNGFWWSSSPSPTGVELMGWILYPGRNINRFPENLKSGRSCRCVKD